MKAALVSASSPVRVRTPSPTEARGPVPAQFEGARNAADPAKAQRHGFFDPVRNFFSGAPAKREVSSPTRLEKPLVKLDQQAQAECVKLAFEKLADIDATLTPAVFQQARLGNEQVQVVSKHLEDLGVVLKLLTRNDVDGGDGIGGRLLGLSDAAAARIVELARSEVASDRAMDVLFGSGDRRESVVTKHPTGLPLIGRFLQDTGAALQRVASEIAPEQFERAATLFQDTLFGDAMARLGTKASPVGKYAEQLADPRYQTHDRRLPGVRFGDIRMREDTAFQFADGKSRYFAHELTTRDGLSVAHATAYPRDRDMPAYLQMLRELPTSRVWVLASKDEIGNRKLPDYFRKEGTWGPHRVTVEPLPGVKTYGVAHVREYKMTVHTDGQPPKSLVVSHFQDWPDRQTLPHEDLRAFSVDQARLGDAHAPMIHCMAGVGRTGTVATIYAMTLDPALKAVDTIEDFRTQRGPDMVQTDGQAMTCIHAQRENEVTGRAQAGARRDRLAHDEVRADWQRQSRLDPDEPDGNDDIFMSPRELAAALAQRAQRQEPIYANTRPVPPLPSETREAPPPLPPKRVAATLEAIYENVPRRSPR